MSSTWIEATDGKLYNSARLECIHLNGTIIQADLSEYCTITLYNGHHYNDKMDAIRKALNFNEAFVSLKEPPTEIKP